MKKTITVLISIILLVSCVSSPFAAYAAANGSASYFPGIFSDVDESQWYGDDKQQVIRGVFENGIMQGKGKGIFGIDSYVTMTEAIVMAARIHSRYAADSYDFTAANDEPWHYPYIDYAIEKGILKEQERAIYQTTGGTASNNAWRGKVALLFASALPESEYPRINVVESVPGISLDNREILMLYRAGVLTGIDAKGTFAYHSSITRQEIAAIALRVVDPSKRIVLEPKQLKIEMQTVDWGKAGSYSSVLDNITKSIITAGMSTTEKIKAIHDFIINNYSYDPYVLRNEPSPYNPSSSTYMGMIKHGYGVCQGYAEMFYFLCSKAGVPCNIVTGTAKSGNYWGAHAWNCVSVDGQIYHIDVTWDDAFTEGYGSMCYDYYLISESAVKNDHRIEGYTQPKGNSIYT